MNKNKTIKQTKKINNKTKKINNKTKKLTNNKITININFDSNDMGYNTLTSNKVRKYLLTNIKFYLSYNLLLSF